MKYAIAIPPSDNSHSIVLHSPVRCDDFYTVVHVFCFVLCYDNFQSYCVVLYNWCDDFHTVVLHSPNYAQL